MRRMGTAMVLLMVLSMVLPTVLRLVCSNNSYMVLLLDTLLVHRWEKNLWILRNFGISSTILKKVLDTNR